MKILVVEDNHEYLEAARRFFETTDHEVQYMASSEEVLNAFQSFSVDGVRNPDFEDIEGVITDMFMPTPSEDPRVSKLMKFLLSFRGYLYEEEHENFDTSLNAIQEGLKDEAPIGMIVVSYFTRRPRIPLVVATDLYHHAVKFEGISTILRHPMYKIKRSEIVEGYSGGHIVESNYSQDLVDSLRNDPTFCKETTAYWENALQMLEKQCSKSR